MFDTYIELLQIILVSYLIGSISAALIIGKAFYKTDIREHGSKNLGGSNAGRILGKKIGILVIILDLLKGFIAVWIISILFGNEAEYIIISGLLVVFGHLFPIYAKFNGGKGVATTGGVLLYFDPILIPIILLIIFIFWLITKYESLATLIAYSYLFVTVLMVGNFPINIIAIIVYVGVFYAYRRNIKAIINQTERKKNIFSKFE